jgi:plastocyanin
MKKLAALLALALASLALVACGGGNDNTTTTTGGESAGGGETAGKESEAGGGGSTVSFEADPNGELAFTSKSATAKAGSVTVEFDNPQTLPHDVRIEDAQGKDVGGTEEITEGSTSATVSLKPGTYTFYCSVPGHREAGMEGTLTVK